MALLGNKATVGASRHLSSARFPRILELEYSPYPCNPCSLRGRRESVKITLKYFLMFPFASLLLLTFSKPLGTRTAKDNPGSHSAAHTRVPGQGRESPVLACDLPEPKRPLGERPGVIDTPGPGRGLNGGRQGEPQSLRMGLLCPLTGGGRPNCTPPCQETAFMSTEPCAYLPGPHSRSEQLRPGPELRFPCTPGSLTSSRGASRGLGGPRDRMGLRVAVGTKGPDGSAVTLPGVTVGRRPRGPVP